MAVVVPVRIDPDTAEAVADRCWTLGCIGIEERGEVLRVYFADHETAAAAATALADRLTGPPEPTPCLQEVWTAPLTRVTAGRFAINETAQGVGVELSIDPMQAFGSGSHPSTRAALELMSAVPMPARVLDVGTGTGILAIGAAAAGARAVLAIDTDADAREAATTNTRRNGVDGVVSITSTPVPDLTGSFGLILANVTIDRHETLAEPIARRLTATGSVIASGMLGGAQEARLVACYPELTPVDRISVDGWSGVALRR